MHHAIHSFADLSTGHLTQWEMDFIGDEKNHDRDGLPRIVVHTYGAWVNVREDANDDLALTEILPNLVSCLVFARANNCSWINFDADAGSVEALPSFEW